MKRLLLLLFVGLSLSASAQWQGITGSTQRKTTTGDIRWNFGPYGVYSPYDSIKTKKLAVSGNVTIGGTIISTGDISTSGTVTGQAANFGTGGFGGSVSFYDQIQSLKEIRVNNHSTAGNDYFIKNGEETVGTTGSLKFSLGTPTNPIGIRFIGNDIYDLAGNQYLKSSSGGFTSTVFGRSGAVVAQSGDYNTSQVTESGNLYFTNPRAIAAPLTGLSSGAGTVVATDNILQGFNKVVGNIANNTSSITTNTSDIALRAFKLVPTAVKTANYTAAVNDLVPVNTTSGNVTITLPTAPADKSLIGIKMVIQGGTNTVALATGGSDVFNKTGGVTTGTLSLLNQGVLLQYNSSGGIWYILADDLSLSQLDLRYANLNSPIFSGTITSGGNILPSTNNTYNLGASGTVWANAYINNGNITNLTAGTGIFGNNVVSGSLTQVQIKASTSGSLVNLVVQPSSGAWSFNLPTSGGTATGQLLSWQGGSTPMSWIDIGSYAFTSPTVVTPSLADSSTLVINSKWAKQLAASQIQYFITGMFSHTGTAGDPFQYGTASIPMTALNATGTFNAANVLHQDGTWSLVSSGFTNPMTTAGDIIYGGSAGAPTRLAIGGANAVLHGGSSAPSYSAVVQGDVTNGYIDLSSTQTGIAGNKTTTGVWTFNPTNTASSLNTNYGMVLSSTVNQTSTAGFTDFLINRINTAPGGGSHRLFDLQVNGSTVFNVNTNGGLTLSSSITSNGTFTANQFSNSITYTGDGLYIYNNATSSLGNPSLTSPTIHLMANAWNTTATAAPNYASIITQVRAVTGSTPTYAEFWSGNLSTTSTPGAYTDLMKLDQARNLSLLNSVSTNHLIGSSSAPTIAAGTGAGTSPTVSITGTDLAHQVNVTTGTSPTASATVATVTFNVAFASAPKVILLTPANAITASLSGTSQAYADSGSTTTTAFVIKSGSGGLAASTAYSWYATVIQ